MITETEFKDAFARYPDAAPLAADVVLAGGRRRLRRRRLVAVAGCAVAVLAVAGGTGAVLGEGRPVAQVAAAPSSIDLAEVPESLHQAYEAAATLGYRHGQVRYVATSMDQADQFTHLGVGSGLGLLVEFKGPFSTADGSWEYIYVQQDMDNHHVAMTASAALPMESLGEVQTLPNGKLPKPTVSPTSATDESCTTPSSAGDDGATVPPNVLDMIDDVRRDLGKTVAVNYVTPGPNPGYAVVEFCGDAMRGYYPVDSDVPMLRMDVRLAGEASGRSFTDDRAPLSSYGQVHHLSVQRIEELRGAPPSK